MARVAAIVLAAGEASRFGSPKQRLLLPGVLERLADTSLDEIVVVKGAHELIVLLGHPTTRVVPCREWERGPGASLRCGLTALGGNVEAAVVVLADGPNLAPSAVERVVAEWRRTGGIVAASYDGARGHPLVLGRAEWAHIPDEGLRDLPVRLVPCDDLGAPGDVDTEEDLKRL
jgi:CTP:molybdopterin cytidylyltransferase MocA